MRKPIRQRVVGAGLAALLAGGVTVAVVSGSEAATTTADLSISASRLDGMTSADQFTNTGFNATVTNKGPGPSTAADIHFTATGGTIDRVICVNATHGAFISDGDICEPGGLAAGQSAKGTVIVSPTAAAGGKVTVRACAEGLDPGVDPVASNNCRTLSVALK